MKGQRPLYTYQTEHVTYYCSMVIPEPLSYIDSVIEPSKQLILYNSYVYTHRIDCSS
mgnify:CR=1